MDSTNVKPVTVPVMYSQSRQTKLGLAVVTIKQEGDLYDATVTISYQDTIFTAEGIFSCAREAYHWSYGVKQETNDNWAGYQLVNGVLTETKPPKTRGALVYTPKEALISAQHDYDNYILGKSSGESDKVSISTVKASTLLSDDDKLVMEKLFAKMGKVTL